MGDNMINPISEKIKSKQRFTIRYIECAQAKTPLNDIKKQI
jgi:hypothetical protein